MDYREVNEKTAIVFDFDGTICQVFKNYDLSKTNLLLKEKMTEYNIKFSEEKDAFDVFDEIISQTKGNIDLRAHALQTADEILTKAEVEAVHTGLLIDGIKEMIPYLQNQGFLLGIATNNSYQCVDSFMKRYFPDMTVPIVGRIGVKPERMKPNCWSVLEVLERLNVTPEHAIFIGDSLRDYECAQRVPCKFIGMAPTEKKLQRLLAVMPSTEIASDFYELKYILSNDKEI